MNISAPQLKPYASHHDRTIQGFQPLRRSKRYQVDCQRVEGVSVIRVRYLKSKRDDWYFRVHQQDVRIVLLTLNKHQQLVILDSLGNLTLYDCKLQVCLAHHHFAHRYDLAVQANSDFLYIHHDNEDSRQDSLHQFDYHAFKIIHSTDIDDGFEQVTNTPLENEFFNYWLHDNNLYLCCPDYAHGNQELAGFLRVNFRSKRRAPLFSETAFASHPYRVLFDHPPLYISTQYGIGIRPHYQAPEFTKEGASGYFSYKIEIFDINSGKALGNFDVYRLDLDSADQRKSGLSRDLQLMSEVFVRYQQDKERSHQNSSLPDPEPPERGYGKIYDRFHQMLRDVVFYPRLSTATRAALGIRKKSIGFLLQFDHGDWVSVDIVKGDMRVSPLTDSQLTALKTELRTSREISRYHNADVVNLNSDTGAFVVDDALIFNIIDIPQWNPEQAKVALEQYKALIQQGRKNLESNHQVRIFVRVGQPGNEQHQPEKYDDQQFFTKVAEFGDTLHPQLVELIEQFCDMPDSEEWYHHEEACFLCYPMHELVNHGEQYLPLYQKYLASVDMDHDVYNGESILAEYLTNKNWTEQKLQFVISLIYLGGQHYYDTLTEFWDDHDNPALRSFISRHYDAASLARLLEPAYKQSDYIADVIEDEDSESSEDLLLAAMRITHNKLNDERYDLA